MRYEVVSANSGKVIAVLHWDGSKIVSTNKAFLDHLSDDSIDGYTVEDGESFLKQLPKKYKSGYIYVNVKKETES